MTLPAPVQEALKEVLRLAVMALIAAAATFITSLIAGLEGMESNETWVVMLTLVLRFVDKYMHEDKNIKRNGLLPF